MKHLTMLAAALVALATPAMAQVDWNALLAGEWGPSTCPPGHTEKNPDHFRASGVGDVGSNTATFNVRSFTFGNIQFFTGSSTATSFSIVLNVYKDGTVFNGYETVGTVTLADALATIARQSFTRGNLTSNTRYTAILHVGGAPEVYFAKVCFRTGYAPEDMDERLDSGTSGCFALGGETLGGGDAAIRACFCGARNRNGQWARTGTVEPGTNLTDDNTYKWLLPSAERTRRGCTSS